MKVPIINAASPAKIPLSENARIVLARRYLKKDDRGEPIEAPEEMFRRVAANIAQAELAWGAAGDAHAAEEQFYGMMARLEFLPNSPTLMNAGRSLQQLAACFVLPVPDDIAEIFDAIKYAAIIHKSGGGTGFSFSRIRPSGDLVESSSGRASGPISFMKVFNYATGAISQGGFRRGANMGILRCDRGRRTRELQHLRRLHTRVSRGRPRRPRLRPPEPARPPPHATRSRPPNLGNHDPPGP
jgi:ribonucleoside-diphosphate reductase alpha chain